MAKEYIEREAAIALASGGCHPANVAKEIAQLPTADVAPVVRCKDCKWWVSEKAYCRIQDNYVMDDDDFCSNGAPKEVNNG